MEPILTLWGVRRVYHEVEGGKEELEEEGDEVRKDKDHMCAMWMRWNCF